MESDNEKVGVLIEQVRFERLSKVNKPGQELLFSFTVERQFAGWKWWM